MAISFPNIPASGLFVPGFYVDFDASQAAYGAVTRRALLVGQTINAVSNAPVQIFSVDQARTLFGPRSMISRMVWHYRQNDPLGELWCLPYADVSGGTAATGSIAVTGPATAAGTIALYVAGSLVSVPVASGDTAATIAAAINTALAASPYLPVTATVSTSTVTLTATHKGTLGNAIDLRVNYRGLGAGEALPTGVGLAITAMSGGATDPSLSGIDALLGDVEYDFIAHPFATATPLDVVKSLLNDTAGRWSYLRQTFGHAFTFAPGNAAALTTLGAARNDQHHSIFGLEGTPSWASDIAAAIAGVHAVAIRADAGRPLQTLTVNAVLAPPVASRWSIGTANGLLGGGIATLVARADGSVAIQQSVTTYQKNAAGVTDRSYLLTITMFTLMEVVRRLRSSALSKFPRAKLAPDGTRYGPGQPVCTPSGFKAELAAEYASMMADGLVTDMDRFLANTIVEINATDPNRLDVLFAPRLIAGLNELAVLAQPRL